MSGDIPFLRSLLYAIKEPDHWRDVLVQILKETGASKGIITLRHQATADFIFPERLASHLDAPLIQGILPEYVESYISKYQICDPWTRIEQEHHPDQPYMMSNHLPVQELEKLPFWEWLEPQNINDAVVAELHNSEDYWVALNLFFQNEQSEHQKRILHFLDLWLPDMQRAWGLTEDFTRLQSGSEVGANYLEVWSEPCAVLDDQWVLTSANQSGLDSLGDYLGLDSTKTLRVGQKLNAISDSLKEAFERLACLNCDKNEPRHIELPGFEAREKNLIVTLAALNTDILGRTHKAYFIRLSSGKEKKTAQEDLTPIWQTAVLSRQQKAIVRWIAEGGTVSAFAVRNSIKESTAYSHWKEARFKLDNITAKDVYAAHQGYLTKKTAG